MSTDAGAAGGSRPRLARHARLRFDPARDAWVLLGPERVLMPDAIAVEILRRCTGEATLDAIVADLAESYDADPAEIARDVRALLQDLAAKGLVET